MPRSHWQCEIESGTYRFFTFSADMPTVQFYNARHRCQPKASAREFGITVQSGERPEKTVCILRRKTIAIISHKKC